MPSSIVVSERVVIPESAIAVTAVRASGPGGQNVNKVSSKVDLRVDLTAIVGLGPAAYERLRAFAKPYLDGDGLLQVTSQKTRDQARNLEDAYEKVRELVKKAMVVPRVRRPTKPTFGSVKRRLDDKRQTSERKASRRTRGD